MVALALVGVVLLFALGMQMQQLRQRHGLEAEERLLRRGRALAASLQAGLHPMRSGAVDPGLAWPETAVEDVFVIEAEPGETAGLCRVRIRGRGVPAGGGPWHDLELETRIFRPGEVCG